MPPVILDALDIIRAKATRSPQHEAEARAVLQAIIDHATQALQALATKGN
jgi:hypothetical protein